MIELFDNIVWNSLAGVHAQHGEGTDTIRRYRRGFGAVIGFADTECPRLDDIAARCDVEERLYTDVWSGPVPPGWRIVGETTMFKMVWAGGAPPAWRSIPMTTLSAEHAGRATELAELTRPGPFGPRTLELGEYVGIMDGGRLAAMAGERFRAGVLCEISGVCTHPDYQGKGLARALMNHLICRELERDELPVLHVVRENQIARGLYRRMGFDEYRESVVRIISRT